MAEPLYDRDFLEWTQEQARLLRQGPRAGNRLDYENLAEEIADLGKRDLREVRSRVAQIVEHRLKLQASPASEPRARWAEEVEQQRDALRDLLEQSPSLRARVNIEAAIAQGWRRACKRLRDYDGLQDADLPPRPDWTLDDILEGESS